MQTKSNGLDAIRISTLDDVRTSLGQHVSAAPLVQFRGEIIGRIRKFGSTRWATLVDDTNTVEVQFPDSSCPPWLREGHQLLVTARPNYDAWRRTPVWDASGAGRVSGQPAIQPIRKMGPLALRRQQICRDFDLPERPSRGLDAISPGAKISKVLVLCGRESQVSLDFTRGLQAEARKNSVDVVIAEASVQGAKAVKDISEKLARLAPGEFDAVVILRGGGSYADFTAFDDRVLVESVLNCAVPVITALGHSEHVPLACLAAAANFDVPQTAGAAIKKENSRRWFASQPSHEQLKAQARSLEQELESSKSRAATLAQRQAGLTKDLAAAQDDRARLSERLDGAQREALALGRQAYRDLLDLALRSVYLKSLSRGLWWCLWTAVVALFARCDTGVAGKEGLALAALPALWAVITFTGGLRAQRIVDSRPWRDSGLEANLPWLRERVRNATAPRDLRRVLKQCQASAQG